MTSTHLSRDFKGYGPVTPDPKWPGGAALAINFVINYEEGGEHSVLYGDDASEAFLTEEPTAAFRNIRNLNVESQYEYGPRAGWWRLYRMFTERNLPVTIFGISTSLIANPDAVAAMKAADFEIACHGLRWINYAEMGEAQERAQILEAIRLHTQATGGRPTGWYTGRMSVNSRRILSDIGGFTYDSDSFSDDLPYWEMVGTRPHLVLPYTLDNNDGRYVNTFGYQSPSFSAYLIQAFDFLRREGHKGAPKMMNVGLHTRLIGRPGRAADLERFLDHVAAANDVWVARRIDIAEHWRRTFPAPDA